MLSLIFIVFYFIYFIYLFIYLFINPHQQSESVFKVHKQTVWIEWRTQGQATYVPPQWKIHKYKDIITIHAHTKLITCLK